MLLRKDFAQFHPLKCSQCLDLSENERISLFHFKEILAEFLINRFSSQKKNKKITSVEPQLALELSQALKETVI